MEKFVYTHSGCGETEGDSFGTEYYTFEYESKELLITAITCACLDYLEKRKEIETQIENLEKQEYVARNGAHKKPINRELAYSLYNKIRALSEELNTLSFNGKYYELDVFLNYQRHNQDGKRTRIWEIDDIESNIQTLDQWFAKHKD